jgi:MoaA/NifB/PqqE/SkfB family radical SAM enzyme
MILNLDIGECYNNCFFCSGFNRKNIPYHTDFNLIKKILLSNLRETDFSITGQDPLLHPNFWDTMFLLRQINPKSNIVVETPGKFLDLRTIQELKKFNIKLFISIYHTDEQIHDTIVSRPGAFKQTIENFKNIKENKISLLINSLILKQNIYDLKNIKELVSKYGKFELRYPYDLTPSGLFPDWYIPYKDFYLYKHFLPNNIIIHNVPFCVILNSKTSEKEINTTGYSERKSNPMSTNSCKLCRKKNCNGIYENEITKYKFVPTPIL